LINSCDPTALEGNCSVPGKINEEQLIRGTAVFTVEKFEKGGIMSAPSTANINQLDNPTRTKANHQSGTNPSV
jgi:hypothetical protein